MSRSSANDGDRYDTVVVGAGLGGLTAGATLARAGRDVLVLERHSVPGGCATTFQRMDFEFEVSLHEIEGLDEHDIKRELFDSLGLLEELNFEPVPEFYRYSRGDQELVVPHGREAAIERLTSEFPHEEAGIRRFFEVIMSIRESMSRFPLSGSLPLRRLLTFPLGNWTFLRYRTTTLGAFLDDIIEDEELKLVLTANLGYYHDDPYSMSLPFFAAAQGGYFAGGGYYVTGGSQTLSDHLAAEIEAHGGTVRMGRLVTDLVVEDGEIAAVRHERSRPGTTETTGRERQTTPTEAVVANAAIPLVADELLPERYGRQLADRIEDWEVAPSLTTLYLGFETPPCDLGCEQYSTVLQHPETETLADAAEGRDSSYGRRTLNFVDYSQVDTGLTDDGKAVGAVSTVDYLDSWTGLTDAEYRRKKVHVRDVLLRRLGDQYPRLPDVVEHAELATPKTIHRYTLNPGGSAYGFAQTPGQSLLNRRIETPVPNLRFASAWGFPGGGFTGAMASGYRAATALLQSRD
ncbi:phytoene desaturase family protein [Haloglomus litoreum]|uniref:phytoene desaturase family protein n=1 Tax=Haloglomus litoreum TaxID=3034026 RepID=UPI0023E8B831|nr:NAD(P)/FAD-dependent oxidoreductase [Haloglomus sp. DT116]